ncbi:MAG TPA: hypothetical protein VM074_12220 [Solimonas sp.]|nr:hypothetical protein [Solimonas sp.]
MSRIRSFGSRFAAACLCVGLLATAAAAARAADAGPTREDIAQKIQDAENDRGLGVAGVVVGALACVGGFYAVIREAVREVDRDDQGRYNPGYNDDAEEPSGSGMIGVVAGIPLIVVGTIALVRNSRELRVLRQQQVRLGYDARAEAMTVGLSFEF